MDVSYQSAVSSSTAPILVRPGGFGSWSRVRMPVVTTTAARGFCAHGTRTASVRFWAESRRFPARPQFCATRQSRHVERLGGRRRESPSCVPHGSRTDGAAQENATPANVGPTNGSESSRANRRDNPGHQQAGGIAAGGIATARPIVHRPSGSSANPASRSPTCGPRRVGAAFSCRPR